MEEKNTLEECKEYLRENWKEGVNCPCCTQFVKLYDYKLYSTSARALIDLYKLDKEMPKAYHVSRYAEAGEFRKRAPHFAELRFWGFIEKQKNTDPKKKSSGFWSITEDGRRFVESSKYVRSRILVFNNQFQGFSDKSEIINIHDALGNEFDYQDLMSS